MAPHQLKDKAQTCLYSMTPQVSSLAIALLMLCALAELNYFQFLNQIMLSFAYKPEYRLYLLCRMPGILLPLFSAFSSVRTELRYLLL